MDKLLLNSGWKLLQDVYDYGEMMQIFRPGWNPADRMEQCFSDWEPVERLVHLQLLYLDKPYFGRELRYFNAAPWWYKKEFFVPETTDREFAFLCFECVDYFCKVWLNGKYLGEHEGYFAPFEYEVGDLLNYDTGNLLVVKVWSPLDKELVDVRQGGFKISPMARIITSRKNMIKGTYEHADGFFQRDINPVGMCGEVSLSFHGGIRFVDEPVIRTTLDIGCVHADVNLQFQLSNMDKEIDLTYRCSISEEETGLLLVSDERPATVKTGISGYETVLSLERPKLWNSWERGEASLYAANMEIFCGDRPLCRITRKFGIREIEMIRNEKETSFVLNRQKIFLRGVSYFPDVYLSRISKERAGRDLRQMKQNGCNAVRVHVHVERPWFYELCDEMGMLVIQDSDLTWFHPTTAEFADRAVSVFSDMVRLLRNHPSIICWVCLNEPEIWKVLVAKSGVNLDQDPVSLMEVSPGPQLVDAVKALDPARPYIKGSHCKNDPESGDEHDYTGSISAESTHYTDIYGKKYKLTTEFGFDAPASLENLAGIPELYRRLKPVLEDAEGLESLYEYQYRYLKYVIEYHRITKYKPCSGYFQFLFTDISPQSFYGIYDWWGIPKKSGKAMEESNQPIGIFMEHKDKPVAIWVVNDLPDVLGVCSACWTVCDSKGREIRKGCKEIEVKGDCIIKVSDLAFEVIPDEAYKINLTLKDNKGRVIGRNHYKDPFNHPVHPKGHPGRVDQGLGMRIYWA